MAIPNTARACSTRVPALNSVRFWLYAIWISLLSVGSRKLSHQFWYSRVLDLTERLSVPRNLSARGGNRYCEVRPNGTCRGGQKKYRCKYPMNSAA
jgi:hypothetical protein